MSGRVYLTLLSRSSYLAGTMVLYHSLQATGTKYPLVVLVTTTLPDEARQVLRRSGIQMIEVELIMLPPSRFDPAGTAARFLDIWTKIQ